ncbi:MAG: type II methionyl aminopeptidase [Promethearchaeota archaeon]
MNDTIIQDYIKAGKAVIRAKELARSLISPGMSFLDIANKCEQVILDYGAELAFPINISLNEIAAHYSPPIDDKTVVPEKGLLKIDVGAHFNGYIADSAFTINIDQDPKLQNYVDGAKEALDAAIEIFKPGTKLFELGEAIAEKILGYGLRPITNLGGHELKQYNLHAGPFIPNYKEIVHNQILQPGDAYACEPFATSGIGRVENGKHAYIYRFVKKVTKNMPYEQQGYMNKIQRNFNQLPFSPRWIENRNLFPKSKIKRTIDNFIRKRIIDKYPILIERSNEPVAQYEHTIVIDMDGKTIVTTKK